MTAEVGLADYPDATAEDTLEAILAALGGGSYATQVDEASSTVTYVGKAAVGSAAGSAVWQIQKITTTGADLAITFADGDAAYDNVWSDRASLTYS